MNLIELLRMNKRLSGVTAWQSNQAHTVSPLRKHRDRTPRKYISEKGSAEMRGSFCTDL